ALYLMLLLAAPWRVLGVSWANLVPLFGLALGATCAFSYVLFRFAMGRVLALLFAAVQSLSTLHVLSITNLRDYTKAPFMLAMIAVATTIVFCRLRALWVIALGACFGALAGIGYGFKPDTLILLPVLA